MPDGDVGVWGMIVAACLGISLSAACGLRVFVPPLILAIAGRAGWVDISDSFRWLASYPAIAALAVATVLEIAAYYIPWLDNLLDSIATPVATIAGVTVAAASMAGMDPLLKWTLAVVAGGGLALAVQSSTVATRAGSAAATGGLANPIIATIEAIGSFLLSILAIILPLLAILLLLILLTLTLRVLLRWRARRRSRGQAQDTAAAGRRI